ncbi:Hypothetical predicted protein [Olea europaea subsp. europaea]|uniref:Uncharacterized protein n=1 Tax=Olea europaea subsp. europaea TaxID=158383 RepID=A0A8S0RMJ1_OLEEU|nr:Hypothetical predicted protein [Olea europaea subsp. europaea]
MFDFDGMASGDKGGRVTGVGTVRSDRSLLCVVSVGLLWRSLAVLEVEYFVGVCIGIDVVSIGERRGRMEMIRAVDEMQPDLGWWGCRHRYRSAIATAN